MQFTVAVVLGLGAGLLLLVASGRQPSSTWTRWTLLGLGAVAVLLFVVGILGMMDVPGAAIPALAVPFAGLVFGIGTVVRGERHWPSVLGLVLAAIPGVFWIAFAIGELAFPH